MQPNRPTSVLVLAIFHFILGGLGILSGLFGVGSALIVYTTPAPAGAPGGPGLMTVASQNQFLNARLPYWKEVGLTFNVVDLGISILMIVAGVGLLQMRPWGRTASLVYGGVSILDQIVHLVYMVVFFLPAMMAFYEALGASSGAPFPPGMIDIMKATMAASVWIALVGFIYPALVLILLLRPSTAAAFRGESVGHDPSRDPYDQGSRPGDHDPYRAGYGQEPPTGYETDDRIGPAPR